jgi:hypothetical protein
MDSSVVRLYSKSTYVHIHMCSERDLAEQWITIITKKCVCVILPVTDMIFLIRPILVGGGKPQKRLNVFQSVILSLSQYLNTLTSFLWDKCCLSYFCHPIPPLLLLKKSIF